MHIHMHTCNTHTCNTHTRSHTLQQTDVMDDESVILDARMTNTESFVRLEDSLTATPSESSEGEPSTPKSVDMPGVQHQLETAADSEASTIEFQSERVSFMRKNKSQIITREVHIPFLLLSEIITTTTPTIPYYTINPSYCWMPDLENQEWWVKKTLYIYHTYSS